MVSHCDRGPAGPAGPKLTGTMSGFAVLVKSDGSQPSRRDSVMVTIDHNFVPTGKAIYSFLATTDSTGKWSIPDVETGIYNLTFTRTGYVTTKLIQSQFTGGSDAGSEPKDIGTVYLCQLPSFSVKTLSRLSALRTDSTSVHLAVQLTDQTITGPYMPYRVFLFLGTDSSVSSDPKHYLSVLTYTMLFQNGVDSTTIKLTPAVFAANGFAAGAQVYLAAYAANAGNNNSSYLDTVSGRTMYANLNSTSSNVLKVTVASDTTGPAGNGSINGIVTLVKANGFLPDRRDSIVVSIDGTMINTHTDSSGAWSIANIGAGTYNFTITRQGYDTARIVQTVFSGSGSKSLGTINLCQIPAFSVVELKHWISTDTNKVRLSIKLSDTTVSDPNVPYRVFLFFGTDSLVSANPSHYQSVAINNVMAFNKGVDTSTIILTAPNFINYGFIEGDTVYIAAYAANAGPENTSYTDPVTGRVVYNNINPMRSNVIKVIVP
jgi:hypothetical protein